MTIFRSQSNQWGIGFGLSRCTIWGSTRWSLFINYGYKTISFNGKKNPSAPRRTS